MSSNLITLRVWGDNACFTRPEMKVERVSYDIMTPSSARAILEAIFWKPQMRWKVKQIDLLKPIQWESVRRNEVGAIVSTRNLLTAMNTGSGNLGMFIEEERQQRAGLFLKDVAYTIHAECELTEKAGLGDNLSKYLEMFKRRASKGQCFSQPYLGCREFSAFFELIAEDDLLPKPVQETKELGWMLYDLDYSDNASPKPLFFRASIVNGSMKVPSIDSMEVRS
ncbi:MAG: type I-C CRISPR-associated protein Cas5 [Blastocatellia bacterium]|nr:type I-C CRISPR-associated protein Cas5 [Blastocatellia bacterium]